MKINISNGEKIQKALDKVQARARVRTAYYSAIECAAQRFERHLSTILNKKDWVGISFWFDPNAQVFASSYFGTPESTVVRVERFASGWFVTDIKRACTSRVEFFGIAGFSEKAEALVEFASSSGKISQMLAA